MIEAWSMSLLMLQQRRWLSIGILHGVLIPSASSKVVRYVKVSRDYGMLVGLEY